MSRTCKPLFVSCGILLCAAAPLHAQVSFNVNHEVFVPGGVATIPGQTVDYDGITTFVNGAATILSANVDCRINVAGCTQTPVIVNPPSSSPLSGVSYIAAADAVPYASTVSMSVTGAPTTALTAPLSIGVTAGDFTQLSIHYSGIAPAPTGGAVVEVSYFLNTTLTDNTTGSVADTSGAYASLSIMDPATYNPTLDANGLPSMSLPFLAESSQGNLFASGAPSFLEESDQVALSVDHSYLVELFAQAGVALPAGSTDDLSVTLSAFADPTFSIDAAWLAANPQYAASDFTITQIPSTTPVAVPEPPVVWLLFTGFGAVALCTRGRRRRALAR